MKAGEGSQSHARGAPPQGPAASAPAGGGAKPARNGAKAPEAHDVLLIPPLVPESERLPSGQSKMLRMPILADGGYGPSEWLDFKERGARKVYNIARPAVADEPQRGPGFSVLPIRPDPGSQYETCFLINTENLVLPNPWSAADWDSFDDGEGGTPARAPSVDPEAAAEATPAAFELLVAGPGGKVFHVTCPDGVNVTGSPVSLELEPEIWGQLREGVVAGTVRYAKVDRVVPIVNVTSLKVGKGAR
jgi:hypothetical protein